ncbi:MAG: 30S ribosomal protein S8 [Syntrophales bacterium]|jgi:small subunit ribosomal protein S8|nr:30S ribosomal protein S8 [Syntrophales bacterium]MDD5233558.1 30S ribosomal protein S8 [Syntrophales bacterium]MDD5531757.1 30S ribosomal protein S8 [Syntrophales bacterium]HPL63945.1 30S ribosomal protein S8 [Syntrophales bacterium]
MGMSDPIADMLTRIRNAYRANLKSVDVGMSQMNFNIAKVLKKAGFISGFNVKRENDNKGVLRIYLKFTESKQSAISGLERVSKPGRRIYAKSGEIPKVLNGFGIAILSTSKGILTDREAREMNIGGEILCRVW